MPVSVLKFSPQCIFASLSQGAPVQRSRSLSPASTVELASGRRRRAEQRIQDLEGLLQLKVTSKRTKMHIISSPFLIYMNQSIPNVSLWFIITVCPLFCAAPIILSVFSVLIYCLNVFPHTSGCVDCQWLWNCIVCWIGHIQWHSGVQLIVWSSRQA